MNIVEWQDFQSDPSFPCAITDIPAQDYRRFRGVNFSSLPAFARSPLDLKREQDGLTRREQTPAMLGGTLLHSLVLEGRADYITKPETYGAENKRWNGNATECKQWLAAHAGQNVITIDEAEALEDTAGYVRSHPKAAPLLVGGVAEISCFAVDAATNLPIKGRLDYVIVGPEYVSIVDLKRTQDASTAELAKTIQFRRYHVQAAMYRRLAIACGAPAVRHFFIAVEDGALPKVNVRELNPRAIDRGDEILTAELALYAECLKTGNWPEWRDDGPGVGCIDLPEWAYPSETLDMEG